MSFSRRVAPFDKLQRDFHQLDSAENLRTTWDVERLILIQSVQGHAHEGHSSFRGHKYPDTSIDHIAVALRLDPHWVRAKRQKLIDEIFAYADRVLAGDENAELTNEEGEGLLGSSIFHGLHVNGRDVLKGLCMGGLRDGPEVRFAMEEKYGITIGGGKSYLVDTRVMKQMGLNADILAHSGHEDMIDYYKEQGLIVAEKGRDEGDMEYLYIRHRRGPGASDDAAIVAAGLLYGLGTAVGVFLADAIDTLEKHVPVFSDQDEALAHRIRNACPEEFAVSDAEYQHLAYLSAVPAESEIPVPDCSLRYMMLINRRHDLTVIESHLLFLQGRKYAPVHMGHEEVLNRHFYEYVRRRIEESPGPL